MTFTHSAALATALVASILSLPAHAATTTSALNFDILLKVKSKCAITNTTISNIDLGEAETTATNLSGSTAFKVLCTKKTPFEISMTPKGTGSSTTGQGVLVSSATGNTDQITYQLRQTTAAGTAWGNQAGINTLRNTGTSDGTTALDFTVFAVVPTIGNVLPDDYKGTVGVTVTY